MRILLVNVVFYKLLGSHYNAVNLGLGYIASSLTNLGYDVWIYNADFATGSYGSFSDIVNGHDQYKQIFQNEQHEIWQETIKKILEFKPDLVGYNCYTANIKSIDIISRGVKKKNKKIKQIVGGPHAILNASIKKQLSAIDEVFNKEGEYFLNDRETKIPIDEMPFPQKDHIWGITKEEEKFIDRSYIITSRGCPYGCSFCASPEIWKRKVRFRSSRNVLEELKHTKEKYNVNEFYVLDDCFTLNKDRVVKILDGIIKNKLNITYQCNTRLDCLDDEICKLLKDSGCTTVKVGIESGSEKILKIMNKKETKETIRRGIGLLKDCKIPITGYFLTGFNEETNEDLKETIEFARELKLEKYSLSIIAPYFGSRIYYDLIHSGAYENKINKNDYEMFYHQNPEPTLNKNLDKGLLKEFFKLAN